MINGPDLRYTRRSTDKQERASIRALQLAVEIERLLEVEHSDSVLKGEETYSVRLAQAICSSLVGELSALTAGSPRSTKRVATR